TVGLALRFARGGVPRLTGAVACSLGALALGAFAGAAALARTYRTDRPGAVVVVPEARLVDERGIPTKAPAVPEAARVDVLERKGALVRVRWGKDEGWTPGSNVLAIRSD